MKQEVICAISKYQQMFDEELDIMYGSHLQSLCQDLITDGYIIIQIVETRYERPGNSDLVDYLILCQK